MVSKSVRTRAFRSTAAVLACLLMGTGAGVSALSAGGASVALAREATSLDKSNLAKGEYRVRISVPGQAGTSRSTPCSLVRWTRASRRSSRFVGGSTS